MIETQQPATAEQDELLRQAYARAVRNADADEPHDPAYIAMARRYIAAVPPLDRALSSGEPL